jgi:hypothetical protein
MALRETDSLSLSLHAFQHHNQEYTKHSGEEMVSNVINVRFEVRAVVTIKGTSSGIQCCVVWYAITNVSEKHVASIFMAEQ